MKATPAEIEKYLTALEETPRLIASATENIKDRSLQARADTKSWSANEILAHLRSCADVWTHSIYAMLAENEPVLPDINERKHTVFTQVRRLSKHELEHYEQIEHLLQSMARR